MAQFTTLPDDMLLLIIDRLHVDEKNRFTEFMHMLLLGLFSRWRKLALPKVYQTLFINYGRIPKTPIAGCYENNTSSNINTNHDLIKQLDVSLVKNVSIEVCYTNSPVKGLSRAIDTLNNLIYAKNLTIALVSDVSTPNRDEVNSNNEELNTIACKMAALIPHILNLEFRGWSNCNAFYRAITKLYSSRLVSLKNVAIITVKGMQFPLLRDLRLDCKGGLPRLPFISPETLESLALSNIENENYWSIFSSCDIVSFSVLETLSLHYSHVYQCVQDFTNKNITQISFPSLQNLSIVCKSSTCPPINTWKIPKSMNSVYINAQVDAYEGFKTIMLSAVKHVSFFADATPHIPKFDTFLTMSQILSQCNSCQYASLGVLNCNVIVPPAKSMHLSLTKLEIWSPVAMTTIVALLNKLYKLRTLALYRVTPDDFINNVLDTTVISHHILAPFNSKLTKIILNSSQANEQKFLKFIIYLVVRISTLSWIRTNSVSRDILMQNLKLHKKMYPHIGNIGWCRWRR
ncbi:hypothetical protein BX667DRAFT_506484 [Coemansia mojavensis]|nr:hypothetical protein BX667DRAFT_506484 [Coemansia mojavensis]